MKNDIVKYNSGEIVKQVGKAIAINNKLLSPNLRSLNIVHLDDHLIFAKGVGKCIIKKYPNAKIKNIQNGTAALAYILHCLYKNEKIDLIITDVSHPGLDGISFSAILREKELDYENRIPLLFITMHSDKSVVARIESIPFVKYLTKADGCLKITTAIENLI